MGIAKNRLCFMDFTLAMMHWELTVLVPTSPLKQELQGELNFAGCIVRVRTNNLAERWIRNLSSGRHEVGGSVMILIVSDEEARCVRQIEEFRTDLHPEAILQGEIFEERKIKMAEVRPE